MTSTHTVGSLSRRIDRSYSGYTMVYLAKTGRLRYGCLGQTCSQKEFA